MNHIKWLILIKWLYMLLCTCKAVWQDNIPPISYINLDSEADVFTFKAPGLNYFSEIVIDEDFLLIGGRNQMYNLSTTVLQEQKGLFWNTSNSNKINCILKGNEEELCENFIRVIGTSQSGQYYICGTNAFNPRCRQYNYVEDNEYQWKSENNGMGLCPFSPLYNFTALYIDNQLFSGTSTTSMNQKFIFHRNPLFTDPSDVFHLYEPNFIGSIVYGEYVYIFFSEIEMESLPYDKIRVSRVGRVCKNDTGSIYFRQQWSTFLKARLVCSIGGKYPYHFNEIQSVTNFIEGQYGDEPQYVIYGAFTTPANSLGASAICGFTLNEIQAVFDGPFRSGCCKSDWLPVESKFIPNPRPGQCSTERNIAIIGETMSFIKHHPLMYNSITPLFGRPIFIRSLPEYRFTKIAVDPQILVPGGGKYDVLYIGTDNGKVLKIINNFTTETGQATIIEEIKAFPDAITGLKLLKDQGRLLMLNNSAVKSIRLNRCNQTTITNCSECVMLQDPYYAWDVAKNNCRAIGDLTVSQWRQENYFYQNLTSGYHSKCRNTISKINEI